MLHILPGRDHVEKRDTFSGKSEVFSTPRPHLITGNLLWRLCCDEPGISFWFFCQADPWRSFNCLEFMFIIVGGENLVSVECWKCSDPIYIFLYPEDSFHETCEHRMCARVLHIFAPGSSEFTMKTDWNEPSQLDHLTFKVKVFRISVLKATLVCWKCLLHLNFNGLESLTASVVPATNSRWSSLNHSDCQRVKSAVCVFNNVTHHYHLDWKQIVCTASVMTRPSRRRTGGVLHCCRS